MNSFIICLKESRLCASHLQCEFSKSTRMETPRFPLTDWLVKVVHYTLTNNTALFSAPASTKWRSSNNTLSASPAFGLSSNRILFFIYLPRQNRRGRQVIRISVFDFSSFKGVFVNVGRWWLRLYFGRLVLSGAPTHPPSVETKGEWGGCVVNLSGGEWGHGVSVKRSTGFLERGWRIYSHCADKGKDLARDWAPQSVCVSLSEMFVSKVIGLQCAIPYTNWFRHLAMLFPHATEHFNGNLKPSRTRDLFICTRHTSFMNISTICVISRWNNIADNKTQKIHKINKHTFAAVLHFNISWFAKRNINCQHLFQWLGWKLMWFKCVIRYSSPFSTKDACRVLCGDGRAERRGRIAAQL